MVDAERRIHSNALIDVSFDTEVTMSIFLITYLLYLFFSYYKYKKSAN